MKKNILLLANLFLLLGIISCFMFYTQETNQNVSYALPVGPTPSPTPWGKVLCDTTYENRCTVGTCNSTACCYGCPGTTSCVPCQCCGPMKDKPTGFATYCVIYKCPCVLDTSTNTCTGGCSDPDYSCGFNQVGNCACGLKCSTRHPDPLGPPCEVSVCPIKGQQCVSDGTDGCTCVTKCEFDSTLGTCKGGCSNSSLSCNFDGKDFCNCERDCKSITNGKCYGGVCPVNGQTCLTNGSSGCTCSGTRCKFDSASGKCTGGCTDSSFSCNFDGKDFCNCGEDCKSITDGKCFLGSCPINGQTCITNGSTGCTCAAPAPSPTATPNLSPTPTPTLTPNPPPTATPNLSPTTTPVPTLTPITIPNIN